MRLKTYPLSVTSLVKLYIIFLRWGCLFWITSPLKTCIKEFLFNNTRVFMDAVFWLSVTLACLLGAMSPGPSLAVIVSLTLNQGRVAGIISAVAHGLGIALYALLTALGLVVLLSRYTVAFNLLQLAGCLYLVWMALRLLFAAPDAPSYQDSNKESNQESNQAPSQSPDVAVFPRAPKWAAARDGFLIALVNPKIIFFFSALFSQFVRVDSELWVKLLMAVIAGSVDMLWYMLVAVVISQPANLLRYQQSGRWLNKVFGLLLLFIVAGFVAEFIA
jgi:threonine/homoserine/homoserine lactone efflux protein